MLSKLDKKTSDSFLMREDSTPKEQNLSKILQNQSSIEGSKAFLENRLSEVSIK